VFVGTGVVGVGDGVMGVFVGTGVVGVGDGVMGVFVGTGVVGVGEGVIGVLVFVNVSVGVDVLVRVNVFVGGICVLVNVDVFVGVADGVTGVFVFVKVFVGVLVSVLVNVLVGGICVFVKVGVSVGVIGLVLRKLTLSISISSAPLALLAHCSALTTFFVKVDAAPNPRCARDVVFIGTVTFVHVEGAVKVTPKQSPSVMDGWVSWNQYEPPLPFT
jgi:hypothetical protein